MTYPTRYLLWMIACLIAVGLLVAILYPALAEAFLYNPLLNAGILSVFFIGVFYIFFQVMSLRREIRWIESFRHGEHDISSQAAPRLLAPLAMMLGERKGRLNLTATGLRSVLDGIHSRLGESHDIARYFVALLVFLGLLGTFWGLLNTIGAVGRAVDGLDVQGQDTFLLFDQLRSGLRDPLNGMGTAFSSSMLGLAGSLVLGFLELQSSQAHSRFVNELEEWLASQTRIPISGPALTDHDLMPPFLNKFLEQNAQQIAQLQVMLTEGQARRGDGEAQIVQLSETLATLAHDIRNSQEILAQLAQNAMAATESPAPASGDVSRPTF